MPVVATPQVGPEGLAVLVVTVETQQVESRLPEAWLLTASLLRQMSESMSQAMAEPVVLAETVALVWLNGPLEVLASPLSDQTSG